MQKLLLFLKDSINTIVSGLVVVLVGGLIIFVVKRLMKYRNRERGLKYTMILLKLIIRYETLVLGAQWEISLMSW